MTIRNDKIKMSLAQRSMIANKQQTLAKTRPRTRARIKPSVIAMYASTFLLVIAMVFISYNEPKNLKTIANATDLNSSNQIDDTSVDSAVATSIAANIAQVVNLPIANSVTSLAISTQTKSEYVQADTTSVTKPQIITDTSKRSDIIIYNVKKGDTVDSIAAKYSISKLTVKWANNLTSDTLTAGQVLKILPVDGVLYDVKPGDTIDSVASKYGVDKTRLVLYNDLEVSGLKLGARIILPSATLPNDERPGYVTPLVTTYYYAGTGTGFGGTTWNIDHGTGPCPTYGYGQCTCYAYAKRIQLGLPVGTLWGNAGSWAQSARNAGLAVNGSPSVGAIIQDWGHVGIVESVLPNGDLSISEMNAYVSGGGWNIVSGRIIPAGNVGQYLFIH